ncbi:hypothetical protein FE257_003086 [Aspergillus nanangensis]|uniref:Gfo/Idh/MocA-like oxidoreductase N-terminal domain-containing protein n=1 Tax=Aspergillus nanangensis TaxID=2582783 RepID=A0AAD4CDB1_ASPNN|nr:hypothetical protein FE257_003086 [Aspergillus nanangensis]
MEKATQQIVRIGIIGCGEITQVAHLPTLNLMSKFFKITFLCDVSQEALQFYQQRVVGGSLPAITINPEELCSSSEVDVVLIANSDEYHADHAILSLRNNKTVFLEKPAALNMRDMERIKVAQLDSSGTVMVGYMRRYASAFLEAIKLIGGLDKVVYARVRDIIGPNNLSAKESGCFPERFSDIKDSTIEDKTHRAKEIVSQAFNECQVPMTDQRARVWRLLGGLGSHDMSAMREALGMPEKVIGASLGLPIWSVLFQYPGFPLVYESGIDLNHRFDAHIEVYGIDKTIRLQFDTPYIKGLPTTIHVRETVNGIYQETVKRITYEDSYTQEFRELWELVVNGKEVKTTITDAEEDLKIFQMIMRAGFEGEK